MKIPMPALDDDQMPTDALREEARIWLSRLAIGEIKQVELQAFKRWQRTSAAHAAAFEDAKRQWQMLKPAVGELLRADSKIAARHERLLRAESVMGRRVFLGAAVSAAAVAGVAVMHPPLGLWPSPDEWSADYRTATGKQQAVTLADRIHLTLNTSTSIRKRATGDASGIDLLTGEAAIDLTGTGGAFTVVAGAGRATAESGRFEVRNLAGHVRISCIDGALRVEHPAGIRQLQARQQTIYDTRAVGNVVNIEPSDVSAWRRGELVFRQTPLAQAVDEINRYRPGRVVLMSLSKRELPVSGRFRIAGLDEAILQLQHTFDLNARSFPANVLMLS
ncbi:FecR family protein [Variovorax sp. W2I14]|uniref:FecR family protein n=1 Tax=Variovorax sp. W2I14 TaxID=3042290 RepID=UPI003D2176E5